MKFLIVSFCFAVLLSSCRKSSDNLILINNHQKITNSDLTHLKNLGIIHNELLTYLGTFENLDSTTFENRYDLMYDYLTINYPSIAIGIDSSYHANLELEYMNLLSYKYSADSLYAWHIISSAERDYQHKVHEIFEVFSKNEIHSDSIFSKLDSLAENVLVVEGLSEIFRLKHFLGFQIGRNSAAFWIEARDNPNNRWHVIGSTFPSTCPDFGHPNEVVNWPIWFIRMMMDVAAAAKWGQDCHNNIDHVQCLEGVWFNATLYSSTI